jgi:hypothetical protein
MPHFARLNVFLAVNMADGILLAMTGGRPPGLAAWSLSTLLLQPPVVGVYTNKFRETRNEIP